MEADVCIVGAGAAGGVVALELARRGIPVVVLESGPRHEFARRWSYVRRYLGHQNPWRTPLLELDRHTVGGPQPYRLEGKRARGVGGSTLLWEGYALRLHESDFRLRSLYGIADDWPLAYDDLERHYGLAETALGVAGAADDPSASPRSTPYPLPPFAFSRTDALFQRACQGLGIGVHHLPQARNSVAYAGRAGCQACGTCQVCPTGAKASIDLTHIPGAEATGNARVISDATVLRIELASDGRAVAVIYAGPDKVRRQVRAKLFVLAAGAVENARLLLLSGSSAAGLANRSGLVGRFFMSHASIDVIGRADEKMDPYRVGFSTAMSRRFAIGPERAGRAAFLLEFLNSAGPTPEQLAVASGLSGEALRRHVREQFGRWLGIRVYCEHLPARLNAVSLAPNVRDYFSSPAPHIHCGLSRYEHAALDEARTVAKNVLSAMGLHQIRSTGLSYAGHQMGTHRMGADPATSVVDANLRCHDVPNLYMLGSGCFVTGSASPPTLTIVALAIRAAEHMAATLGRPGPPERTDTEIRSGRAAS